MALWILGCGGEVESDADVAGARSSETEKVLECGALPDPATCVESNIRVDESGCHSLVCNGWPDNPFNPAKHDDFYQVLECGGVRGIIGRINGEEVCQDRWK